MLGKPGQRLDREVENALVARAQAGDVTARNALIEHHLPFIRSRIAAETRLRRNTHVEEHIGEATLGFIRAINGFDASRGLRLITYASHAIHRSLICDRLNDHAIRTPEGSKNKAKNWEENYRRARAISSIDAMTRGDNGDPWEIEARPDGQASRREAREELNRAIGFLDKRYREVVRMRFSTPATLDDVATALGVCKERARQIEAEAVQALGWRLGLTPRRRGTQAA